MCLNPKLSREEALWPKEGEKKLWGVSLCTFCAFGSSCRKQKVKKKPKRSFHHRGQQNIHHWDGWTPTGRVSLITVLQRLLGKSALEEAAPFNRSDGGAIAGGGRAESRGKGQRSEGKEQAKPWRRVQQWTSMTWMTQKSSVKRVNWLSVLTECFSQATTPALMMQGLTCKVERVANSSVLLGFYFKPRLQQWIGCWPTDL